MIPTDTEQRLERLKTAESMICEAAGIVEECLHMTDFERRFGDGPERLREISSSKEGDSVSNLIREVEYSEEDHPGWTRPLASVKNVNRKDI